MNMSELSINIGIDWGTSFTKLCVRANDTETSEVVVFDQPTLEGTLLVSKIGIKSDGKLLAGKTQREWKSDQSKSMVEVDFIKMRLANVDLPQQNHLFEFMALSPYKNNDLNDPKTLENLGAYYLSQVIQRVKDWFCKKHPDRVKNRALEWSANVGVPVEYYDSPAKNCFERVLRLGWLLTEQSNLDALTFTELNKITKHLRSQISDQIPCFAIPEVAAGTYFYATSQEANEGNYLYVDIGSGTTELCSFYYRRQEGSPQISAIKAYAPPIGIDAIANGVASECSLEFSEVQNFLNSDSEFLPTESSNLINQLDRKLKQGEFIASADQKLLQNFELSYPPSRYLSQEAIEIEKNNSSDQERMLLELMLWERAIHLIIAKRPPTPNMKEEERKVFLGGGGRDSGFYQYAIKSTYKAFKQYKNPERYSPIEIEKITIPESPDYFTMNGVTSQYSHRFAIAFGLSIPEYEMPDFELPSFPKPHPDKNQIDLKEGGIKKILDHLNPSGDWRDK